MKSRFTVIIQGKHCHVAGNCSSCGSKDIPDSGEILGGGVDGNKSKFIKFANPGTGGGDSEEIGEIEDTGPDETEVRELLSTTGIVGGPKQIIFEMRALQVAKTVRDGNGREALPALRHKRSLGPAMILTLQIGFLAS
ncbi:hypothetical protein LENED_006106 [Lentinula edodes]|uniref:Uncharacterized protein n=1 Tax=Lentinula edodes TaxID=5353 RepID=A0A1Q3EAR0_LENED|nr:hypothetical protein LENED_006106 [Lentinula edodes]